MLDTLSGVALTTSGFPLVFSPAKAYTVRGKDEHARTEAPMFVISYTRMHVATFRAALDCCWLAPCFARGYWGSCKGTAGLRLHAAGVSSSAVQLTMFRLKMCWRMQESP